MKYFFYDLETTGTKHWRNGIHQISGIVEVDGVVMEEFDYKVQPNPKAEIEDEAMKIGGVTKEQVMSYTDMNTVYRDMRDKLAKYVDKYDRQDKMFLVGYNNRSFDDAFFRAWFVQNHDNYFGSWFYADSHDVLILASYHLKHHRHKLPDFKLHTVCRFMGIEVDETRLHDAVYDIYLTRSLYTKLTMNMSPVEQVVSVIDAKRGMIRQIKEKSPAIHRLVFDRFLKDQITLTDLERAFVDAIASVGIVVSTSRDADKVNVLVGDVIWTYDSFEDAFKKILEIL